MESGKCRPHELVARFVLLGALTGLPIGLLEAFYIYRNPSIPLLLYPDSSYVIWFLDPLVLVVFFGFLGLLSGVAAISRPRADWLWVAFCISFAAGVADLYLALVTIQFIHGELSLSLVATISPAIWGFFSCVTLVVCRFWSRPLRRQLGGSVQLLKLQAAGLLLIVVALSTGVEYCRTHPFNTGAVPAPPSRATSERPNIVFIVLDTVRADHLSIYGYQRPTTPNLERWAKEGVVFDNAIAPAPWTLASHASMFSGLLPHQHGGDWAFPLGESPWTLAEILKTQGYETAAFNANCSYGQRGWGYAQGFQIYEDNSSSWQHNLAITLVGRTLIQPVCRIVMHDEPLGRRNASELNHDIYSWFRKRSSHPYFLFINYFDVHAPYLSSPPYERLFGHMPASLIQKVNTTGGTILTEPLRPDELIQLTGAYDNCLAYLDFQLDKLLRFLESMPAWKNTMVIVTSDHGEDLGERSMFGHGWDLHLQELHVPLIMLGPGIPRGERIQYLVGTRELFSTVLDFIFHGKAPFHRRSLSRFWRPGFRPQASDKVVVSERTPRPWRKLRPTSISLMTPQWQYIQNAKGEKEVYDWVHDPEEKNNLAELPEYSETLDDLQRQLEETVSISLRPWQGTEYLHALDEHGRSFLPHAENNMKGTATASDAVYRIGMTQAHFHPQASTQRPQVSRSERELLQSLPYQ